MPLVSLADDPCRACRRPCARLTAALVALLTLLAAGCGNSALVSAQPRELILACPDGMVLIHAGSFPAGPHHPPVPRSDQPFDPATATPFDADNGAKPTMILLPGYCIDRLPAPPAAAAAAGADSGLVSYAQAQALCRARGLRLCSTYEWELACRGEELTRFPYGNRYDPDCGRPTGLAAANAERCQSSFGVYDQLGGQPEWVLGPMYSEIKPDPAQMGGLLATEEPAGVDCLTIRIQPHSLGAAGVAFAPTPAAADSGLPPVANADGNLTATPTPSGLAAVAQVRCCGDPLAKSQYILNYDK